jgi:3-phenylpropionate/cinnamic acid dioxygenase small subunit
MDRLLLEYPDRRSSHMNTNLAIEVDGDTATSSSDYVMFTRQGDGAWQVFAAGRYQDRLVRRPRDGTWRFAERTLVR